MKHSHLAVLDYMDIFQFSWIRLFSHANFKIILHRIISVVRSSLNRFYLEVFTNHDEERRLFSLSVRQTCNAVRVTAQHVLDDRSAHHQGGFGGRAFRVVSKKKYYSNPYLKDIIVNFRFSAYWLSTEC